MNDVIEVVFNCITDFRIRDMLDLMQSVDEALEIKEPCKELFFVLENFINKVDAMSNSNNNIGNIQYEDS